MYSITSDFLGNFLAQTRSRQPSTETSLLRRDQVMIQASRSLLAIFVGTFGLALVAELTSRRFVCARFVTFGGPMPAIRAEMPSIFALFTSISCFHVGGPPVRFQARRLRQPSAICAELLLTSERNFLKVFNARYPALTFFGPIRHTKSD